MGSAINALGESLDLLRDNPKFTGFTFGTALLTMLITVVLAFIPLIGSLLTAVIAAPLFLATLTTMAYRLKTDGEASTGDWMDGLNDNFLPIAGANAIYQVAVTILTLGLIFVLAFTSAVGGFAAGSEAPLATLMALGPIFMLVMFLFMVFMIFVGIVMQFIDVSVVIGDAGVIDSFGHSFNLVKEAPLSTIGYTILRGFVPAVMYAVLFVVYFIITQAVGVEIGVLVAGLLGLVTLLVVPAWMVLYHVAYYMDRRGDAARSSGQPNAEQMADYDV